MTLRQKQQKTNGAGVREMAVVIKSIKESAKVRVEVTEKNKTDAWGWCTGTIQRDGVGREEGGGFRMGKHMYTCGGFILIFGKTIQLCKI